MTTLIEELKADQDSRASCRFCAWLDDRTKAERAEWVEALKDRSFTNTSLFRAAKKRGYNGSDGSLENHRKRHPEGKP